MSVLKMIMVPSLWNHDMSLLNDLPSIEIELSPMINVNQNINDLTIDELLNHLDDLGMDKLGLIRKRKTIPKQKLINYVQALISTTSLLNKISSSPKRILFESCETSEKLYIELWGLCFKSEPKHYTTDLLHFLYDNNLNIHKKHNTSYPYDLQSPDLFTLKAAVIYLQSRELYVKLKHYLLQYFNSDIIRYIIICFSSQCCNIFGNIIIR